MLSFATLVDHGGASRRALRRMRAVRRQRNSCRTHIRGLSSGLRSVAHNAPQVPGHRFGHPPPRSNRPPALFRPPSGVRCARNHGSRPGVTDATVRSRGPWGGGNDCHRLAPRDQPFTRRARRGSTRAQAPSTAASVAAAAGPVARMSPPGLRAGALRVPAAVACRAGSIVVTTRSPGASATWRRLARVEAQAVVQQRAARERHAQRAVERARRLAVAAEDRRSRAARRPRQARARSCSAARTSAPAATISGPSSSTSRPPSCTVTSRRRSVRAAPGSASVAATGSRTSVAPAPTTIRVLSRSPASGPAWVGTNAARTACAPRSRMRGARRVPRRSSVIAWPVRRALDREDGDGRGGLGCGAGEMGGLGRGDLSAL